jgi:hypothetical protein
MRELWHTDSKNYQCKRERWKKYRQRESATARGERTISQKPILSSQWWSSGRRVDWQAGGVVFKEEPLFTPKFRNQTKPKQLKLKQMGF